jgi:hypothetical protein
MTGHDAEKIMQWSRIFVEYSTDATDPRCTFCSRADGVLTRVGRRFFYDEPPVTSPLGLTAIKSIHESVFQKRGV